MLDRCAKAKQLLGFVEPTSTAILDSRTRRTVYQVIVHSVFGYGSQVCRAVTKALLGLFIYSRSARQISFEISCHYS